MKIDFNTLQYLSSLSIYSYINECNSVHCHCHDNECILLNTTHTHTHHYKKPKPNTWLFHFPYV